jgi:hypothetical protein
VGCAHGPSEALVGWLGPDDAGCALPLPDEPPAEAITAGTMLGR